MVIIIIRKDMWDVIINNQYTRGNLYLKWLCVKGHCYITAQNHWCTLTIPYNMDFVIMEVLNSNVKNEQWYLNIDDYSHVAMFSITIQWSWEDRMSYVEITNFSNKWK